MDQPSDSLLSPARLRLLDETSERGWWTPDELAWYFDLGPGVLDSWRDNGTGPPWYLTDDGEVRYDWMEVGSWTMLLELRASELELQASRQQRRRRRQRHHRHGRRR